jgi:hypothetical protein
MIGTAAGGVANGHEIALPCTVNHARSREHVLEHYTLEMMARDLDECSRRTHNQRVESPLQTCGEEDVI